MNFAQNRGQILTKSSQIWCAGHVIPNIQAHVLGFALAQINDRSQAVRHDPRAREKAFASSKKARSKANEFCSK